MKGFFSIRTKFLGVMSALLVSCLLVYLLIAMEVFKTDKTELIFDLNRSMVSNLSTELETQFVGVSDKFRLFALLSNESSKSHLLENIFGDNSDVVFASLFRQQKSESFQNYTNKKYLETYGLDAAFFESTLPAARPVPFAEILKSGEYFWNASIENGAPLIGYGRNVVIEDSKGRPVENLAVIGYIRPDKILKVLNFVKLSEVKVLDQYGNVLVHPDLKVMNSQKNYSGTPLFKTASESKINSSVASLQDERGEFLAAYSKAYQGKIFVLARAQKDQAFSAVHDLVSRSLSFGLIVITLSLLFAFLLSRSLTEPISLLVSGMEKVSGGDLNTEIKVNSRDETQMLASSFNQMIRELKQSRDELQEINRALDKKVKERTRQLEIQNQAVKEAQEALLKTTRLASAGEIAGRAAHEVLNPLTGILTRLSSIEKKAQSQFVPQLGLLNDIFQSWKSDHSTGGFKSLVAAWEQPSSVDQKITLWQEDMQNLDSVQHGLAGLLKNMEDDTQFLLQESRRINKIISGMRKLSSLNSDVKTYSVSKLLVDCKNIMADLYNQQSVDLFEEFSVVSDNVDIDRDEFIQAVTNLMRNSLQAMKKSSTEHKYFLKIKTQLVGQNIMIEISDNGVGVPEVFQKMLFEQQFTTKSADEGTGLGLGISRRFIRAHGGDIQFVGSTPFSETMFRISLPLKVADSLAGAA